MIRLTRSAARRRSIRRMPKSRITLALTLSEKGVRGPAEVAAFRKAIQYDPGYGDAHANLAFVYLTQKPPLVELARWHYKKALEAGHAHDPSMEKLLDQAKTGGITH